MLWRRRPFTRVLVLLGGLLLLVVVTAVLVRGLRRYPVDPGWQIPGGDPERGRLAILRYGCGACHTIEGIPQAQGRVGPQLREFEEQIYIAGRLPNVPPNLIFWIQNPQEVDPLTAMPNLLVTEDDARDIAAYLYRDP